jgi:hypothetical protein
VGLTLDAIAIILGICGAIAAIGMGLGIVGLINQASYGYPLFGVGLGFLIVFIIFAAISGRDVS